MEKIKINNAIESVLNEWDLSRSEEKELKKELAAQITERIEKLLNIPAVNYRTWQVDEIVEELKDIDAFDAAKYFFDKYGG